MQRTYDCPYAELADRIVAGIPAANGMRLDVQHDPWCKVLGGDGRKKCHPKFTLDGNPVKRIPPPLPNAAPRVIVRDHDREGVSIDPLEVDVLSEGTALAGTVHGKVLRRGAELPRLGVAACQYCWTAERKMAPATHAFQAAGMPSKIMMCAQCAVEIEDEIRRGVAEPGSTLTPLLP